MMGLLIEKVWISIALSSVFYIMDYYLGHYEGHLYHSYANAFMVFDGRYDGYEELNESGTRKWLPSTSFLIVLVVVSLGIYVGWYAFVKQFGRTEVFAFVLGGIILFRVATILIHFRRISLFHFAKRSGGLKGKVQYSKKLSSTLLYLDFYGFAFLYLVLLFIQGGWFLAGGILTCFIAARRHRDWVMVKT